MPPLPTPPATALAILALGISASTGQELDYEVVAMLKDSSIPDVEADVLPGMESSAWHLRKFERASIDGNGLMVFRGETNLPFQEGIWCGVPGDLRLIGRVGSATSPGSGRTFDAIRDPSLDAGYISFLASSSDQTGSNGEIWSGEHGAELNLMASTGETAPGGGRFEGFYPPSAMADGSVVFIAETDAPAGAGSDFGIYHASTTSGVSALLRANSATQGFPDGGTIGSGTALISHPTGGILFRTGSNTETSIHHIPDPESPVPRQVVALQDLAPGTGERFRFLSYYTLNARGEAFFAAATTGIGHSFFSDQGIWKSSGTSMIRVIRGGEPAPGTGSPLFFESLQPSNSLYGRVCDAHGRGRHARPSRRWNGLLGPAAGNLVRR